MAWCVWGLLNNTKRVKPARRRPQLVTRRCTPSEAGGAGVVQLQARRRLLYKKHACSVSDTLNSLCSRGQKCAHDWHADALRASLAVRAHARPRRDGGVRDADRGKVVMAWRSGADGGWPLFPTKSNARIDSSSSTPPT